MTSTRQCSRLHSITSCTRRYNGSSDDDNINSPRPRPKAIIFDLDGCLWRPEMYELVWFSKGQGAPFTPDPDSNDGTLLSTAGEPVRLIGDVRDVMREFYDSSKWDGVAVGISSKTDEPDWARELLRKFVIGERIGDDNEERPIVLQDVFEKGPIEIAKDGKVKHFQRIANKLKISFGDMLFLDNESGNCRESQGLGLLLPTVPTVLRNRFGKSPSRHFRKRGEMLLGLMCLGMTHLKGRNDFTINLFLSWTCILTFTISIVDLHSVYFIMI